MAARVPEPYHPTFLVDQDPNRFGGMQSDFLRRARQAIEEARKRIISARENKEDLRALFFELIATFSKTHAEISKDHKTVDADSFGKRRDLYTLPQEILQMSNIVLAGHYQKYLAKMLALFSQHLKQMELTPGKFEKKLVLKDEGSGLNSNFSIEVLTGAELVEKGYCRSLLGILPESLRQKSASERSPAETQECHRLILEYKQESPENYYKGRVGWALSHLNEPEVCPSPAAFRIPPEMVRQLFPKAEADTILGNMKSLYVIATLETEISGKMKKMTTYLTWMYETRRWLTEQDPAEHPIERMKQWSKVMILHQDNLEIVETLDKIADVFVQAVTWERSTQSIQELKDTMALLLHSATHNIRDMRGTAAENEWLEEAIYGSLPVDYSIDRKNHMVDLEAFTNPLFSDFKLVYNQIVDVR